MAGYPTNDLGLKGFLMNILHNAGRVVTRTADATTAAAGAVGGAVVNGVVGAVQGTATGVKNGLASGSHSTSAAALTFAAIGAAGLVDWPVLVAVGGTALLVHQLSHRSNGDTPRPPAAAQTSARRGSTSANKPLRTASKASPRKSTRKPSQR